MCAATVDNGLTSQVAKNRQVLIDLLRHLFIEVWKYPEIVLPILLRATAMLMSFGKRLSVLQCKQSFDSVHDKEFESN